MIYSCNGKAEFFEVFLTCLATQATYIFGNHDSFIQEALMNRKFKRIAFN